MLISKRNQNSEQTGFERSLSFDANLYESIVWAILWAHASCQPASHDPEPYHVPYGLLYATVQSWAGVLQGQLPLIEIPSRNLLFSAWFSLQYYSKLAWKSPSPDRTNLDTLQNLITFLVVCFAVLFKAGLEGCSPESTDWGAFQSPNVPRMGCFIQLLKTGLRASEARFRLRDSGRFLGDTPNTYRKRTEECIYIYRERERFIYHDVLANIVWACVPQFSRFPIAWVVGIC